MSPMTDGTAQIADKARGVAAEKRLSQETIAATLGISRQAVNARFNGKVPFTAPEILKLAEATDLPVSRFFPERGAA